jgi:hypothetical protein
MLLFQWPYHDSDVKLPDSHCENPGLIPEQSVWELYYKILIETGFSPSISVLPFQYHSTNDLHSFVLLSPNTK